MNPIFMGITFVLMAAAYFVGHVALYPLLLTSALLQGIAAMILTRSWGLLKWLIPCLLFNLASVIIATPPTPLPPDVVSHMHIAALLSSFALLLVATIHVIMDGDPARFRSSAEEGR